jgi:hypothetical protein
VSILSLRGPSALLALAVAAPAAYAAWPPPRPAELRFLVRETAGVARHGEVVVSGLPLARAWDVRRVADLAIVDAAGSPVPAELDVLARWHGGLSDEALPIQWLRVAFPATVGAHAGAAYRLVTDGSAANPPPLRPLVVERDGDRVTVRTGVATFVMGGAPETLFDELRRADGTRLAAGGTLLARVGGQRRLHRIRRAVRLERAGPLTAVVIVEGAYDQPAVGGGGLGSWRRYEFRAGAPTAIVRQAAQWEGDRCGRGVLACGGAPNALRLERWRDTLRPTLGGPFEVTAVGAASAPERTARLAGRATASVRQLRRPSRLAPLAFRMSVPGASAAGAKADGALLAVAGPAGAVAVALDHMHRYEPQALRRLAGGAVAIDLADAPVWLGARQGLFARLAVAALPPGPRRADLDRQVWAPLNHPLRAWPSAQWAAASGALEEFPVGKLPPEWAAYDELVRSTLDRTLAGVDATGLGGLATFGSFPRIWGNPIYADELECGEDPTPAERWDDAYWCGAWTDYHNAAAAAVVRALRTGEVEWLDEIAFPAAWRMLHTQVFQCAPGDPDFYCGQAPAGYGGFRSDFNSSHQYFDNLILYAWLAGDESVARFLGRGAATMRGFLCDLRWGAPPGPTCPPERPIADPWAGLNGRVATQFYSLFRFLGLAADPSYLADWTSNTARWLTQYYVQTQRPGGALGLVVPSGGGELDRVEGPGAYFTGSLWMTSLYDLHLLHRLGADSGDAPLGSPPLAPSQVEAAWARTLLAAARLAPWGDGTASGPWPDGLRFAFSGARLDGALTGLGPWIDLDGDGDGRPCELCEDDGGACFDLCLYATGKAALAAAVVRAADATGDPELRRLGEDLTRFALAAAAADPQPLNKLTGEYLSRLHAAVARLALSPR